MSELYGFKKNLEKVQVRSKSESAAKSHLVPTLIDGTPMVCRSGRYDYTNRTIPELANWNVVVLACKCGNIQQNIICFRGANTVNHIVDSLTDTVTRALYYVDWVNNRIRIRWDDGNAALIPSFVQITAVYGLVQNVDVVDHDTEDEGGDEGEDIDITGLTEEVQGIRIGADGTIYETAGEAVREQYNKLAEMLDVLNIEDAVETIQNAVDTAIQQIETAGGLILDPTLTQSGQAADAKEVGDEIGEINDSLAEYQDNVKLVKNLVPEIVQGYLSNISTSSATLGQVLIVADSNRSYAKVPVIGGKTYSVNRQFSGNFSFWAYKGTDGIEYGISKISSFETNYVITAPANAEYLYLCNSGWNVNTDIVVLETEIPILWASKADYPFNTVVKIEAEALTDLYNMIDVMGVSRYSKWERGGLSYNNSSPTPTKDTSYTYSQQRICTPAAIPLVLNVGDVLSINGNTELTFYVGHYNSVSSTWVFSGWITADYIVSEAGSYWVSIRRSDNADINHITDLSDSFTITKTNGVIKPQVDDLQERITRLEDGVTLPDYYYVNDWLGGKIDSVNSACEILNGVAFAFITDLHFRENSLNSKYLLKKILDNTNVPFVIAGGDFPTMYGLVGDLQSEYETLIEYANYIGKDKWFAIRGNHDFYNYNSASDLTRNGFIWAKTYNGIYRNSERWQSNALAQDGCYCIDIDAQKTRIICLNSNDWNLTYDKNENVYYISVAQAQWFLQRLAEKDGWKIIVISHVPSDSAITDYHESQEIIQNILIAFKNKQAFSETYKSTALSADFTNTANQLICHITGHNHKDESHVDNGVLSITTTCDAHYLDDGHGAVVGTVTEQAFDVFCINYDTGTINAVRVGRGSSRNWSY